MPDYFVTRQDLGFGGPRWAGYYDLPAAEQAGINRKRSGTKQNYRGTHYNNKSHQQSGFGLVCRL
jgi:hypothetical protein